MADNTPSADIVDTLCQRVSAHIATYACAATIFHRYHAVEKSLREGSAYPPPILAAAAILTASKLWAVSDLMMSEALGNLVRVLVDEEGDCGSTTGWKDVHGAVLGAELSLLCTIGYDVSLSYRGTYSKRRSYRRTMRREGWLSVRCEKYTTEPMCYE